jgi:hypothetical protein
VKFTGDGNGIIIENSLNFDKLKRYDYEAFLATEVGCGLMRIDVEAKKLTVAPALQPVRTDNPWVIFVSPESPRYVLPQKSLEALSKHGGLIELNWSLSKDATYNLTARFGASRSKGGRSPRCKLT